MSKRDCEDKDSKVFSAVLPKVFSGNSIAGNSLHNSKTNPFVSCVLSSKSDSKKHPGLHGLYAASSQSVQQWNRWHVHLPASRFQAADLFWRWWHCHTLRQVTEEKPVLCMESTRPTHWRHQVFVRTCWSLIRICVFSVTGCPVQWFLYLEPNIAKYLPNAATISQPVHKSPLISAA